MRAVMIMYDSLNKRFLTPYGSQGVITPNFQRLAEHFLEHTVQEDNWYLHLEYFDPHEPFDCPDHYKRLYEGEPLPAFDWPLCTPSREQDPEGSRQAVINCKACVSMCDDYLGRILDFFDAHDMWKDSMLIVNTDHGYMLGEHGYFAKSYMPCYEELKSAGDQLYTGFNYCGNIPMRKIPGSTGNVPNASHHQYDMHLQHGDLLFDRETDWTQEYNLRDDETLTQRMVQTMIALMKGSDAPQEQYQRMGFAPEQYA